MILAVSQNSQKQANRAEIARTFFTPIGRKREKRRGSSQVAAPDAFRTICVARCPSTRTGTSSRALAIGHPTKKQNRAAESTRVFGHRIC
jgi:hypothetical protein